MVTCLKTSRVKIAFVNNLDCYFYKTFLFTIVSSPTIFSIFLEIVSFSANHFDGCI